MKDTVFLKSRKRGITVAMAVTMILIIALMTTTVTIAVVKTVKGSNLKAFATELSLVQTTIQEYSFSGSINEYLGDDVTLTVTSTEQFDGETVESNTVLLHVLDLSKMGIEKSVYGTGKDGNTKDYYAVSLDTMKVYYIAGYDSGDKVYYALTDELIQMLNGENKAVYTNNILFKPNTVEWTNKPVTVKVLVPTRISTSTVTVHTSHSLISISSATLNGEYNEYTVNTAKIAGNYVITVKYTLNGSEKTETYTVSNFDNEAPTVILRKELTRKAYYLNDVKVVDNGRVKKLKYIEIEMSQNEANDFFKTGGIDIVGERVKLSSRNAKFTIYAEDFAGNYTTSVVTIPSGFFYVGGTKATGLVISDKASDENKGVSYTCVGNQFVWIPVEYTATGVLDSNGLDSGFKAVFKRGTEELNIDGIYRMTGEINTSTYVEPYASGFTGEVDEYYAMCKSVQSNQGFYVARFEAGDSSATQERTYSSGVGTLVSKKNAYVYNYVPWGASANNIGTTGAVYLSQNMYKEHNSVVSTLCYGVQWDAIMNYIADSGHNITNSTTWGYYGYEVYTCGYSENWKAKNIYDIAGNASEWTMEKYDLDIGNPSRVNRDDYYGSGSYSTADRMGYGSADSFGVKLTFRVTLYLKEPELEPTIPSGFYYVGGTKNTGFVISDNSADENKGVDYTCVGNQFVWVPVDDYSKFVRGTAVLDSSTNTYKMTGTLSTSFTEPYASGYSTESTEYNAMCASVQEYGGFYIARFEAGDGSTREARTAATDAHTVVSKKGAFVYNYVPWGVEMNNIGTTGAVYLSQNMYKNHESVVSTLCYGVQWDATLNFVSDADHDITDSRSWGNYRDSTGAAETNKGSLQKTGTNEAWKAKNIYDLAGNVYEWTMEACSYDYRVYRGGHYYSYSSSDPASNRSIKNPGDSNLSDFGFRPTLYIIVTE